MEIDHGGFELGVAHVPLDDAQVDTGFKQVRGIGMTQGVDGDALFADAGLELGATEGALDTTPRLKPAGTSFGHGCGTLFCPLAVTAKRGKEETRISMGDPVATKEPKGCMGQGNIAILGALTPVHMNHHAVAVD